MRKNYILFCSGFFIFALLCFGIFFYFSDAYIRKQITFTTYDDLTLKNISKEESDRAVDVHTSCFDDNRRKKLTAFYMRTNEIGKVYDKRSFEERLNRYLKEDDKEKYNYFKEFREEQTVTLVRYKGDIIGLYTCDTETKIIENSRAIWDLCLTKTMRGKGISHLIVEHAIKTCSSPGMDLALVVYKDDKVAQSLYKKHSFKFKEPRYSLEDEFNYYDKFLMKYEPDSP